MGRGVSAVLMAFVLAVVFAVSAVAAAPGVARAATVGGDCSLGTRYPVSSVEPYQTDQVAGVSNVGRVLRGADIYVVAQPGVTREWLQRQLESEVVTGACDFGVDRPTVDVISAGGGFTVRVSGPSEAAAHEILRRAEPLAE